MIIKTKLSEKDFINVNFVLLYKKALIKILTGISFLGLLIFIASLTFAPISFPISSVFYIVFVLGVLPLVTFFTAKKNYKSNKRISEDIEYQFHPDALFVTGESFTSQLSWDKIHKVTKTKNWLLIWQSSQMANVIPLQNMFTSELDDLKSILLQKSVKNNLT
jgi:hypothetical protein